MWGPCHRCQVGANPRKHYLAVWESNLRDRLGSLLVDQGVAVHDQSETIQRPRKAALLCVRYGIDADKVGRMSQDFRLLMIGAMYENGGNTTHRLLDGHPQLYVYPFESQLGTRLVNDQLASTFPVKYRWPVFALDATPEQDYAAIIDEETKVRARTPNVSKFRHVQFEFEEDERREAYVRLVERSGRSRA